MSPVSSEYPYGGRGHRRFTETEKWCNRCQEWLPHDRFWSDPSKSSGLCTFCKSCSRINATTWKRANPAANLAHSQGARARYYGLSRDELHEMVVEQDGLCAICRSESHGKQSLHIDHDHTSGRVRALLCGNCNRGIGMFQEDPAVLESAITYLRRHT